MSLGDLLYQFTDWLRTTPLVEFSLWISETSLSTWIVTHFWAIPIFQTLHILFIGGLFGAALMMNLRVLGLIGNHRNIPATGARYLPWIKWCMVGLIITGILMIIGEPVRELINPVFWVKMALIIVAVIVSLAFHRSVATTNANGTATAGARFGAIALIILWCAIMAGGRWIAYAPV